jgi:hypothetical protein
MDELPLIRHFLACDEIIISPDGERYSLVNLIHAIRPLPGVTYPRRHPLLCLFVQMTNGRGSHVFRVEFVSGVGPAERTIYATPSRQYDLGNDPLAVLGLPIRLENLSFPAAGQYEFHLICDEEILARTAIELREPR